MVARNGIEVVYENGVFRPETPVNIPEHARLRINIVEALEDPAAIGNANTSAEESLADVLLRLRAIGAIRGNDRLPTRDELHEDR